MQNTATQNYSDSVAFYNTRPGNEAGLFHISTTLLRWHMAQYITNKSVDTHCSSEHSNQQQNVTENFT